MMKLVMFLKAGGNSVIPCKLTNANRGKEGDTGGHFCVNADTANELGGVRLRMKAER